MQVRVVNVLVAYRRVPMPVRVRLRHRAVVGVPVMLIMQMGVLVLDEVVQMLVLVPLSQVEPSCRVRGSPSRTTAITAPMNGASEK